MQALAVDCQNRTLAELRLSRKVLVMELGGDKHFGHAVAISIEALKALLLVNGGAATALIALKTKGESGFALPVLLFGLAALLNAFTLTIGYFSQLSYANSRLQEETGNLSGAQDLVRNHRHWQRAAIIVLLASLAASTVGMATAFYQIDDHPAHRHSPQSSSDNAKANVS